MPTQLRKPAAVDKLDKKIALKEAELQEQQAAAAALQARLAALEQKNNPQVRALPAHVYVLGLVCVAAIGNAWWSGAMMREALEPGVPLARATSMANPRVFLDVEIDGAAAGRIEAELFENIVPRTALNFKALATGERGAALHFVGTPFHRIVPGFVVQGGDIAARNGRGEPRSIYGGAFEDENFELRHDEKYLLSMANSGPDTNGCQFFITVDATPWLDGRHVVFGRVEKGRRVVDSIETAGSGSSPSNVVIAASGVVDNKRG